ncbi:uncharacterized acetyltransferase At3g50280-like [Diospyros lotus]|uniref:uncharacterized acetyltransferase At3g50280-like n=1 Tax=Diospyros lotus TaxID=55363 RepID=UPI00225078D1|nr:uncharacterized acetyltransferase At3g50280-like [Diospyros lotus]
MEATNKQIPENELFKCSTSTHLISDCFVNPKHHVEASKHPIFLSPWDLAMLSVHYIQKGLLFLKPPSPHQHFSLPSFLQTLKESLSLTLVHFYPLAGRLVTLNQQSPPSSSVYIDCTRSPGARFIHAAVNLTVSDILSPVDVPVIVQSFFDHDRAINHDGHTRPLLSVKVTDLVDGVFVGCSFNHAVGDGESFWMFFNTLSEIFRAQGGSDFPISRLPIHNQWILNGHGPLLRLPFADEDQFLSRHEAPPLRERIFHFSSQSIAQLKAKANQENNTDKISSLQAVSAVVWRCITRARRLPDEQQTNCRMAANNRSRMEPPVPKNYFGNCIQVVCASSTAAELLGGGFGRAAWLCHRAVGTHTDKVVREWVGGWLESPIVYQLGRLFDPCSVMMGSSPRFDVYGNEFGIGKAVAVRSGYANKFDGKVTLYPGREGGGSMDLEICLSPETMAAFESDREFRDAVWESD